MKVTSLFLLLLGLSACAYVFAWFRVRSQARVLGGIRHLKSLPPYYGFYAGLWLLIPAILFMVIWMMSSQWFLANMILERIPADVIQNIGGRDLTMNTIANLSKGLLNTADQPVEIMAAAETWVHINRQAELLLTFLTIAVGALGFAWARWRIRADFSAQSSVERIVLVALLSCAMVAILTTLGIVLSVLFESIRFFQSVSIIEFVFGLEWSPQTAIREGQVGSSGRFGAVPLFLGTMMISFIAMMVAIPAGLMSAVYLAEYAGSTVRQWAKPILEILAGIPTVVYGFFAALTVAPQIRGIGEAFGLSVASESALAAGAVMGVMIIPFVSSLSDDVITAVPRSLRDGSLAMGATRSETMVKVIFPAALPGIMGGILLAVSRAIGETMIVVMAAGLAANMTANPLDAVTTVTVQIVTLLTGDQEFDSPKTLAAFALGLMLFIVTLTLNFIAINIVKKYREQYD